jgi:hypothetical protein
MDNKDLENRFAYHKPKNEETAKTHEAIRTSCLNLAVEINWLVPECDEKKTAIKRLEEVMMWANAGVARNE